MINLDRIELLLLFAIIIAIIAVLNPKKKVSNYKSSLDFTEQDKINKENI